MNKKTITNQEVNMKTIKNIEVTFKAFEDKAFHVATYTPNTKESNYADVNVILENVFSSTQNKNDSWSNPACLSEDGVNYDYSDKVKVVAKLPRHKITKEVMGHRSSSVGDLFKVTYNATEPSFVVPNNVEYYRVAGVGFQKITYTQYNNILKMTGEDRRRNLSASEFLGLSNLKEYNNA